LVTIQQHRICIVSGLLMCKKAHFADLFLAATARLNGNPSEIKSRFFTPGERLKTLPDNCRQPTDQAESIINTNIGLLIKKKPFSPLFLRYSYRHCLR
jgi:hypothetical protein